MSDTLRDGHVTALWVTAFSGEGRRGKVEIDALASGIDGGDRTGVAGGGMWRER
ncbi:MAG: hypothetical protein AAGA90_01555 [Actinomycetota bacterium]